MDDEQKESDQLERSFMEALGKQERKERENVGIAAAVLVVFSSILSIALAAMAIYLIDQAFNMDFSNLMDNGIFRIIIAGITAFFLAPTYFDRTKT